MTPAAPPLSAKPPETLRQQVRRAVIWRSGTQIVGQLVAWVSTFLVIRILSPSDYGLFAMTQVVLSLLNMLNGYGLASALIRRADVDRRAMRQLFGMLIVLNLTLGALQFAAAPLASAYFRQPEVAQLLRVQSLIYLATPFIAFPYALLAREMDFAKQAWVNLGSAVIGAVVAIGCAQAGLGVWTLVAAPMALFGTRAIGMMSVARAWMWPSFDFRGARDIAAYGGLLAAAQFFWFLQSQADVFIGGRMLDPHDLGIYTTSLFLAQILVAKFVPPVNEVAFAAYARIHSGSASVAEPFLMAVRTIMLVALPCYLGLAICAEPLVQVVLGPKWSDAAPVVALLALAMPFMTVQVLFSPATDARGRPEVSLCIGMIGAAILTAAFLVGVHWGAIGLAIGWVVAYPAYVAIAARSALPVIGVSPLQLWKAVETPLVAGTAMGAVLFAFNGLLPSLPASAHLAVLIAAGAAIYAAWLLVFSRAVLAETWALVRAR